MSNEASAPADTTTRLTGQAAIDYAAEHGCTLSKYADPTEDDRDDLSVEEAREVAREDGSLIYIDVASESVAPTETLTNSMIEALRREAGGQGDEAMVHVCWLAMGESERWTATTPDMEAAREQCAAVITSARAMDDSKPLVKVVA